MLGESSIIIFSPDSEFIENISRSLSNYPYRIFKSFSKEDYLETLKKTNPEILIVDSDIEFCEQIKKNKNDTDSISILIGRNNLSSQDIEKSNANYYLEYPLSDTVLQNNIILMLNEFKLRKHFKQITESVKESEEKYKRLFQLSPDGIGYHVGGKIGFVNDAGIRIFGGDSFDDVFGKYFIDFVHPYDKEFVFNKTKNAPYNKPLYYECRIITLKNKPIYVDIVSTPFILGGVNAIQFIFRDITEKKTNELKLIENGARLEFVQRIARLGYWELDVRSNNYIWSKDIFNIFGLSESDYNPSFKNLLNIIHTDDRKMFQKAFDALLSGAVPLDIEHRVIWKDKMIYVHQKGAATFDEKGNIVKLVGSVQDITERKKMENALRESQSRFANIINSAMDAVITIDINQKILLFNSSAEKMFQCRSEDAINQSLDKFIPNRFREMHKKHIENFGKTGITMRSMGSINPIYGLRCNGKEFPIEASISQVETTGQKLFTVIIRDITERKKSEEALISSEARYRLLFKKNPLPMMVYDVETMRFVAVNFVAVKTYGYNRDEFISMTVFDITPDEDIISLKNYLSKNRNPLEHAGSWRHKKKDGTIIDVEIVSHEIEFDGRPSRIVLVNDITDKKKAEEELINSREQLRLLAAHLQNIREEERTAISREIHDELGQVLTSLKMNLVFINKKLAGNELKISIPDLRNEIYSMTLVIDESVKRIRKIITELRPEVLDHLGLVSALEWQASEFKIKSGIDCRLTNTMGDFILNKNISITIFRIFQEALTNVMRHSKATLVEVKIGRINNYLELEISDNGIGIDTKKISKSKTFGVLGMKERIVILGGDFNIESNMPTGTRVKVNIPLDAN